REKSSRSRRASSKGRSIILIEQPDPRHFRSRPLGEQVPRLGFFPDPDSPRLGHFAHAAFNRLQFLLARLLEAALVGPTLAPLGAPLFSVRAFDVGIAGPGEDVAWRGGLFIDLFSGFCRLRRRLYGLRCRCIIGGLLFSADIIGRWRYRLSLLRLLLRLRCLLLWLRLLLYRRRSGVRRSHMRHRLRGCRRRLS